MILWGIGGIFGYATFGFIGRRPTILFYNVGTLVVGLYLYLAVSTRTPYMYLLPIFGYSVFGVFSGHAIYLPELFLTHVRATAFSFCNEARSLVSAWPAQRRTASSPSLNTIRIRVGSWRMRT
jgi:hypothetical protein